MNSLKDDILSLEILGFEAVPDFTVVFKSYVKYLKNNMNIYLQRIVSQINKDVNIFYLDSSSLVTSKLDKEARFGKSTRLGWYSGFKLHLICDSKGIPISFDITTANIHDSRCEGLIESLSRKLFNVSSKLLLFTIEKSIAVLKIIQYFCNSLAKESIKL